jgi:hypothetical protein
MLREIPFNNQHDPQHPTTIETLPRDDDHSHERTDKRPSEVYFAAGAQGSGLTLAFHEGSNPANNPLNGWLIEDVLAICLDRLQQHQQGPFACRENALAATKVEEALFWMHRRRASRKARNVSGTQTP